MLTYPVNPTAVGTGVAATAPYSTMNGGVVGPVGNGWLPGDPNGGPYTGTALATGGNTGGITNVGGAASSAYELWCASDATRITDWGQLTNLGPNLEIQGVSLTQRFVDGHHHGYLPVDGRPRPTPSRARTSPLATTISGVSGGTLDALAERVEHGHRHGAHHDVERVLAVGQGAPIGIPVRILGVNGNSGTEATWASYANSGVGATGNCSGNMNTNAAARPEPGDGSG